MASLSVELKHLEIFKQLVAVVGDVSKDERIPVAVREEVIDKVNYILESNTNA